MFPSIAGDRAQVREKLRAIVNEGRQILAGFHGAEAHDLWGGAGGQRDASLLRRSVRTHWRSWRRKALAVLDRSFSDDAFAVQFVNACNEKSYDEFRGGDPLAAAIESAIAELEAIDGALDELLDQGDTRMEAHASTELDPWPVIAASLFELESDDVVEILGLAGLQLDLSLSRSEAHSHKTRRRAYRPRLEAAYSELSQDSQLRVCSVVAGELSRRSSDGDQPLAERLHAIGWDLVDGRMTPSAAPLRELFLAGGREHDAYVEISSILHSAKKAIYVVDPYIDGSLLKLVASAPSRPLDITVLTSRAPTDFTTELDVFRKQHSDVTTEVRRTRNFHDRFVILDDAVCYHIGASIKDAGRKAFMISRIEDRLNSTSLIQQQKTSWANGSALS
jgi:hypothetical protein